MWTYAIPCVAIGVIIGALTVTFLMGASGNTYEVGYRQGFREGYSEGYSRLRGHPKDLQL